MKRTKSSIANVQVASVSQRQGLRGELDGAAANFVSAVLRAVTPHLSSSRSNLEAPAAGDARRADQRRKEQAADDQRVSHRVRRLRALQRAVEWQLQLESGEVGSRSEIATREGISLAAVTQAMRVLNVFENGQGDLLPMRIFRTRRKMKPS